MQKNLFWDWLKASGYKVPEIAAACGVSRSAVYNWAYGLNAPTARHLAVLHKLSRGGVQPWWFTVKDGGANG